MQQRIDWTLLGTTMLVSFLTGTASRIFAISLPTVALGLHTDIVGISWALLSFQLATLSLSLIFGRIGDVYGRHTVYIWGIVVFTFSSLLCSFAQDIVQLIVYRLLQGVGAAMIQAQGRALAMEAVPDESVGKAQGLMTTAHHSGFLLGPSIGGFIIDYLHWRGIFFCLVPLGCLGTLLGLVNKKRTGAAPEGGMSQTRSLAAIDYPGAFLLVAATLVLIGILDRRSMEWLPFALKAIAIVAFCALTAAFLIRESVASSPILLLSLFKMRMFSFSTAALLIVSIVMALSIFLLPFYLQDVLRLTPSFMGILFVSAPIFAVTLSPVGGYISDKIGPMIPATAGAVLFAISSAIGIWLRIDSHWIWPTIILALGGLGTALFFPANHAAMIGSVPREHRGVATGSVYTMFGLGNILGITLANFLMTVAFRGHTGLPNAVPTAELPAPFVLSLNETFLITTAIGTLGVICSMLRGK